MPKILNSALPPGTLGLWWFPQSLANLGHAGTGAAVPFDANSIYAGGRIYHQAVSTATRLATTASVFPITNAVTIMLGYQHADTALRAQSVLGLQGGATTTYMGTLLPYNDSKVYWDVGGETEGSTRLSVAITKDSTTVHVWGFTAGSRGMEIWRDGVKIASHAGTPTRTVGTQAFYLGTHRSNGTELGYYSWVFLHNTQLSTTLIQAISADPEGQLTEESGGGGGGAVSATVFGGAVVR
jgi:hypothetical protein